MSPAFMSSADDLEPLYPDDGQRWRHRRLKNYLTCIFMGVICFIAFAALIAAAGKFGRHSEQPAVIVSVTPIVNTSCGFLQGRKEDAVFVFKGIPYGAPPVGPLRWQPTHSTEEMGKCWTGIKRAFSFGPMCYQYHPILHQHEGQEDCLYLNVWTPQLDQKAELEVMVYIHGGGLMYKSGNEPGEIPTPELTTSLNAVIVSFNYRLNAFGFMALDALSSHSKDGVSGNYGYYDMVTALKWVKNNIRTFGGSPDKVTVMGHGAGGEAVLALMTSPRAKGLFQRAWTMSGFPEFTTDLQQAEHDNELFVNKSGCGGRSSQETADCLYGLTAAQVVQASPWFYHPRWIRQIDNDLPTVDYKQGARAIIDGVFLSKSPRESIAAREINDVPLLIGNTAQDIDDQPAPSRLRAWTWRDYNNYVMNKLDPFGPNVSANALTFYPHDVSPEYQFSSMVTDLRMICPTSEIADLLAKSMTSPVYRYIVTSVPSVAVKTDGCIKSYAFRTWDILAMFGAMGHFIDAPTKKDLLFTLNMRSMAKDFMADGAIENWQHYPAKTCLISDIDDSQDAYKLKECQMWARHGFYPDYAWQS